MNGVTGTNLNNWPNKKYNVIVSDPPWQYYGQQDKWGAAAKYYTLMDDEDIFSLPMSSIMEKRSVLFLWTTSAKLETSLTAIKRWHLYYRGIAFVWIKTRKDGTPVGAQGVRPSITKPLTEFVLVASTIEKGRPLTLFDESIKQTIFAPKSEHSKKPDEVQARIERMYPNMPKLEMFARRKRPGWDVWGNEV